MDVTALMAVLLNQLWFLLPLLLLATIAKSPWFKGMIGEWLLNLSIRLFLDRREYHLLSNVTLPLEQGSTQIDQVLVSRFGVFVIETKNMKGGSSAIPDTSAGPSSCFDAGTAFKTRCIKTICT